jgi:Fe-S-cluster containining protein
MDDSRSEWYADGLRFSCTQCGNCCTGPPGAVWFSKAEGLAMAARMDMTEESFYATYAHQLDGQWSLVESQTEAGFDCIFLDRKTIPGKATCGIYETRPAQCRTWPFWPENLKTQRHWETVKRRTPCPGMNSGKLVPIEQIRIQRDQSCAG